MRALAKKHLTILLWLCRSQWGNMRITLTSPCLAFTESSAYGSIPAGMSRIPQPVAVFMLRFCMLILPKHLCSTSYKYARIRHLKRGLFQSMLVNPSAA